MTKYKYPNGWPLHKIFFSSATAKNPIPFLKKGFDEFGDTYSISSGISTKRIVTCNSDIIKYILQKNNRNFEKSAIHTKYMAEYMGKGLLTAPYDDWKKQRRLIQPVFYKENLRSLGGIISDTIDEQIGKIPPDEVVDVHPLMNSLAFNVMARSLFNYSVDDKTINKLREIMKAGQIFMVKEIRQPHKRWWYNLNGEKKSFKKMVEEGRDIINKIIEARRKSGEQYGDLLDMLLHSQYEDDGSYMTNEQVIDEVLVMFVAGHETSVTVLTIALLLLAKHPEAIDKLRKDIHQICGDKKPAFRDIAQLDYSRMVVEETMRLYPPAWASSRVANSDDELGEYKIKKGTMIYISIYELHRNPKYWDNADQFIPERFAKDKRKALNPYYIPFGAGPRLCIGNNLALYEMILTISRIIMKYDLTSYETDINVMPLSTLVPVRANIKFTHRS